MTHAPIQYPHAYRRALLALVAAATLAACGVQPTGGPRDIDCTYPGAAVQCRGINPY